MSCPGKKIPQKNTKKNTGKQYEKNKGKIVREKKIREKSTGKKIWEKSTGGWKYGKK
jgi:hypothetical protein